MNARERKKFLAKYEELRGFVEALARERGALSDRRGRPFVDVVKTNTLNIWALEYWEPEGTNIASAEYEKEVKRLLRRKAVLALKRAAGVRLECFDTFGMPAGFHWPRRRRGVPVVLWTSVDGWPEPKTDGW